MNAEDRPATQLIVALDVEGEKQATEFVQSLQGSASWFKVGLELFTAAGPSLVNKLVNDGYAIMLDLKMHDIPETVARAVKRGCDLGARMLTIHASGGTKMMEAAQKAAEPYGATLLAVTVLTSLERDDLRQLGLQLTPREWAVRLANFASLSNIGGIVCSAHEVGGLKDVFPSMRYVVPGIRPEGADTNDQKRVATPAVARAQGADFIVVGRPIRDAADRPAMVHKILKEMGTPITANEGNS